MTQRTSHLPAETPKVEMFQGCYRAVMDAGYSDEIEWQRDLKPCSTNIEFANEACWVILNSGMREQIARLIWDRVIHAWRTGQKAETVFNHKGKCAALEYVKENSGKLFVGYVDAEDKITYLQTIPFIGKITCYHLAKNLGHDCVKPDRHLVRIAKMYNTDPNTLCKTISDATGEKVSVVDIVLWRAANLQII